MNLFKHLFNIILIECLSKIIKNIKFKNKTEIRFKLFNKKIIIRYQMAEQKIDIIKTIIWEHK